MAWCEDLTASLLTFSHALIPVLLFPLSLPCYLPYDSYHKTYDSVTTHFLLFDSCLTHTLSVITHTLSLDSCTTHIAVILFCLFYSCTRDCAQLLSSVLLSALTHSTLYSSELIMTQIRSYVILYCSSLFVLLIRCMTRRRHCSCI